MATLDHLLEELFEACSVFDTFPPLVNHTLIDRLVDCLDFEEPTLTVMRRFVRNLDFEGKVAPIRMAIRLLDAAIKSHKFRDDNDLLLEFIEKSEAILTRPRNQMLLQDLFNFYTNPVVFAVREPESWLVVIRWVMNEFADEYLSCFHIDLFVKFICQIPSAAEARRLHIISEAISPDLVGSFSARIIYNYAQDLTIEECNTFVNNFRRSSLGYCWPAIRMLLKMRELHPSLQIPLAPASWSDESRRVNVISKLLFPMDFDTFRMMNVQFENVEALVDSVLDSPVDLYLKEKMLDHMNERQFEKYFDEFLSFAKIESNDVNIHVASALRSLTQHATRQKVAQLFEVLGDRILDISFILHLSLAYGPDAFDFPEFEKVKNRFSKLVSDAIKAPVGESNAERIITVLDCMKLFPCFLPVKEEIQALSKNYRNFPSVINHMLNMMRDNCVGIPEDLIQHVLGDSSSYDDSKAICLEYLMTSDMFDLLSADELEKYLDVGLPNVSMQKETIKLAEKSLSKAHLKDCVISVITMYEKDPHWLGRNVRRLLNKGHVEGQESIQNPQIAVSATEPNPPEAESICIINEMMSSLKEHVDDN